MAASVQLLGLPEDLTDKLNLGEHFFGKGWDELWQGKVLALAAFGVLAAILFAVGRSKSPELTAESAE
jgi:hypothetical protein